MEDIKKEAEVKEEGLDTGDTRTPNEEEVSTLEENSSLDETKEGESLVESTDEESSEKANESEPAQEEGNVGEGTDALGQAQEESSEGMEGSALESLESEVQPVEKTFTQSQVNEIVGNRVKEAKDRFMKELFERYGVNGEDEMNDVFGKGQIYADLSDEFESGQRSLREANGKIALLESGIVPERWDDVKAILGASGREISAENIALMLPTHPEWKANSLGGAEGQGVKGVLNEESLKDIALQGGKGEPTPEPIRVTKLGADPSPKPEMTEQEQAENIFGYKFN